MPNPRPTAILPRKPAILSSAIGFFVKKDWQNFSATLEKNKGWLLFFAALSVYLFTRFLYLEDYPVYFFTDEAAQQVRAHELWDRGFFDEKGHFLPVTAAGPWFRFVSIAHYLQMPAWLLFGNSIYAVRGTSIILTASGMFGLALILKRHFECKSWWLAPLVMVTMPGWFLHSRTAFECVYTVVFYVWFSYFYLNYTSGDKKSLFWAVAFGGLTFYSYSAGPLIMGLTGLLLLFSDAPYHWQNRKIVAWAFLCTCCCLVPLAAFYINYPESPATHAELYSTILSSHIPFLSRLQLIVESYLNGLRYGFWFHWEHDNPRHEIPNYSLLLPITAPFLYFGLLLALLHFKKSRYRFLWMIVAASAGGGLFVQGSITRNMIFLIAACLLIIIALDFLVQKIPWRGWRREVYSILFACLVLYSLLFTFRAVIQGPLWCTEYTLYGLQWGSKQVVRDAIPAYLKEHPGESVRLATEWSNSPEFILKFFDAPPHFTLDDVDRYMAEFMELPKDTTFVVTHSQYGRVQASKVLLYEEVAKVINYPDGKPGFHFIKIKYVDHVKQVFADIVRERNRLHEAQVKVDGETWSVRYCSMDLGDVERLFDKDTEGMNRGAGGYPFVVEVDFPAPKELKGVDVVFRQDDTLTAILKNQKGMEIGRFFRKLDKSNPQHPLLRLDFPGLKEKVRSVRLEMREENRAETDIVLVHLTEITFF